MSDRDQLAALLARSRRGITAKVNDNDRYQAGDVIAAGWQPPARRIETPEELDALPFMSIILAFGVSHQAVPDLDDHTPVWVRPAAQCTESSATVLAHARGAGVIVLWTPTEAGTE
ncbi:hypothetical protein [Nocardia sp. NPDC049707]|uniref:hypothetical protein n=1 Tax=Nocardia sp. NPDC049707 TaxID=3154735 RepID=UPI00343E5D9E